MEIIFPWERDDIVVRSGDDGSAEATEGAGFASMVTAMSKQADDEARIRSLADGVRAVERDSDLTAEAVLDRVASVLEETDRPDGD